VIKLTTEQQFSIALFAERVKELSREEAQQRLVEMLRVSMQMENSYRALIADSLGVSK
jgi:hypothetical protein